MAESWEPTIQTRFDAGGDVVGTFSPWDPGASFVKVCLVEEGGYECRGKTILEPNETSATFTAVPCNKTFQIKLRSYNGPGNPRQGFYWTADPVRIPCPTSTPVFAVPPSFPVVPVVCAAVAGVCLVLVIALLLWLWRTGRCAEFIPLSCLFQRSNRPSEPRNNKGEYILPVYIKECDAHERAVLEHLHLLRTVGGLNVICHHENHQQIRLHTQDWVNNALDRCSAVLIYHSRSLESSNNKTENYGLYDNVSWEVLEKLEEKFDKRQIVVTFDTNAHSAKYNIVKLVKDDQDPFDVINFDIVVKSLTGHKPEREPSVREKQSICHYVAQLYGETSVEDMSECDSMLSCRDV